MKTTPLRFWASSIALLQVPGLHVLAEPTTTSNPTATTSTSEEPSCTASLVTKLCDYPSPFRAVASSGRSQCWDWCNENQPCDFIIFMPGNPHLGDGSCYWYPGESFDESKGTTEGCGNPFLEVYDKPVCEGSSTTTSGACAATASPSAIASVCDYPTPDDDCWNTCTASLGAVDCLSQCAESDDCSYVVYNPRGETNSPYEPGTCWMYPDGEYNPDNAGTCGSGGPEQYVYENVCPKPSKASTLLSSSASPSATNLDGDSAKAEADGAEADRAEAGDIEDAASVPVALSLTGFLTVGLAMLL